MDARLSLVGVITIVALATVPVAGQARQPAPRGGAATASPRTPWGHPDLQGIWTFKTITPLERPAQFAKHAFLTEQEAAGLGRIALKENTDEERPKDAARDVAGAYNDFWFDRGDKTAR